MTREGRRIAAALIVLLLPDGALALWLSQAREARALAAFLGSVFLVLWLTASFARSWRAFFLVNAPIFLLSLVFAAYTLTYGGPPGDFVSYVLATTTWSEFAGFFSIWQGERLLLGLSALLSLYVWLALRVPAGAILTGTTAPRRLAPLIAVLLVSAYAAQHPAALVDGLAANPLIGTPMFVAGPLRHALASVEGTAVSKRAYGAARVAGDDVHVLVIGESARRDSWSAYGYVRPTTPHLQATGDGLVLLRDALADANITIAAVPMLLTGTPPDRFDLRAVHGTLLDLAREAGFRTSWLMNQDPHISLLLGIHADRMVYPPALTTLMAGHLPLDGELLPILREELSHRGAPQFIGLHLIGSHWQYASRYPADREFFPTGAQGGGIELIDAYDNSIRYTDWLLGEVIGAVAQLPVPATVTYVADHGEDLQGLDGATGHGGSSYSSHQFHIPAFVWMNEAFRAAHPGKFAAIAANASKRIRSYDIFYSVADLMGITWPGALPQASFASPAFVPDVTTPVIAGGIRVSPGS